MRISSAFQASHAPSQQANRDADVMGEMVNRRHVSTVTAESAICPRNSVAGGR